MILRRLILAVLIVSVVVPSSGLTVACCFPKPDDRPQLVVSSCCCPAECALQSASCDAAPDRVDARLPEAPASSGHLRLVKAVGLSRVPTRFQIARAPDPPRECAASLTVSCHGVSLPLRL